jgi:hypothetical protein
MRIQDRMETLINILARYYLEKSGRQVIFVPWQPLDGGQE